MLLKPSHWHYFWFKLGCTLIATSPVKLAQQQVTKPFDIRLAPVKLGSVDKNDCQATICIDSDTDTDLPSAQSILKPNIVMPQNERDLKSNDENLTDRLTQQISKGRLFRMNLTQNSQTNKHVLLRSPEWCLFSIRLYGKTRPNVEPISSTITSKHAKKHIKNHKN